jgi:hypothetical protein
MGMTMKKNQIHCKKWVSGFLISGLFFFICLAGNTGKADEAMDRLSPFMGKWKTTSLFPGSGEKVEGDLEYSWVLGKKWIKVEFKGNHPERDYWEAYVMIKFDQEKNQYRSYDFFSANDPVIMSGRWISPVTIRFEFLDDRPGWGIDYTIKKDGTITQENWQITDNNQKKITLLTDYRRN